MAYRLNVVTESRIQELLYYNRNRWRRIPNNGDAGDRFDNKLR
jgi:hypothetical protein